MKSVVYAITSLVIYITSDRDILQEKLLLQNICVGCITGSGMI
jgi:hypothetical protein